MTTLLNISDLSVALQNKTILSEVNLTLAQGDILGLVGPSGCGKTTLLNTLAGFIDQQQGEININGEQAIKITAADILPPEQRNIGMIFQDYALFPHLTVSENICFGIQKLTKKEQQQRCSELLSLLALADFGARYPHQLSGGQQQRVAIARALAPRPALLLLDEPFSNIDARLRNELMIEIRQLLKSLAMTAIFVTHNKDEVFTFADQIAVMHQGSILQFGTPAQVCQQPNCWQVADFLQLGSWLPADLCYKTEVAHTALGKIPLAQVSNIDQQPTNIKSGQLLIKASALNLQPQQQDNVEVSHISVTEQGYHYILASYQQSAELAFQQLSFYSQQLFQVGDKLSICLHDDPVLLYPNH